MKPSIRRIREMFLTTLLLLPGPGSSREEPATPAPGPSLLETTLRLRYERRESPEHVTITGHGTAFAVDLSAYGLTRPRHLLTAAHNIRDSRNRPVGRLEVEVREGGRTRWEACTALRTHGQLDLCLLEARSDLPALARLGTQEVWPGEGILLGGSPCGVPPQLYDGILQHRFNAGSVLSLARVPFDHGDSGGPVFDPRSGTVIGVAVAGIPTPSGAIDHSVGLYIPLACIRSFLEEEFADPHARAAQGRARRPPAQASPFSTVAATSRELRPAAPQEPAPVSPGPNARQEGPRAEVVDLEFPSRGGSTWNPRPAPTRPLAHSGIDCP